MKKCGGRPYFFILSLMFSVLRLLIQERNVREENEKH